MPRRVLLLGLLALAALVGCLLAQPQHWFTAAHLHALGPWAAPAFAASVAVGAATFLPKPLMAAVGGALFGFGQGLALSVAGTVLGAALAFAVARALGREGLSPVLRGNRWGHHWERMDAQLTHRPFRTVLVLRAIPFVPFQAITFGAALSGIRRRHFLAGTALGVVPALAVGTAAGAALTRPGPWNLTLLGGAAVLVGALLLVRRLRGRAGARVEQPAR